MTHKQEKMYNKFMVFCDGDKFNDTIGHCNTFLLGVTKLSYDDEKNTFHVYLRRPGLLIGKGGENFKKLREFMKCEIQMHEVTKLY